MTHTAEYIVYLPDRPKHIPLVDETQQYDIQLVFGRCDTAGVMFWEVGNMDTFILNAQDFQNLKMSYTGEAYYIPLNTGKPKDRALRDKIVDIDSMLIDDGEEVYNDQTEFLNSLLQRVRVL